MSIASNSCISLSQSSVSTPAHAGFIKRGWVVQAWEISLLGGALSFAAYHAIHIYEHVVLHPGLAAAELIAAWLLADLGSGVIHWAGDRWGSPSWPIVGPALVVPFRHHHHQPKDIATHDLLETNGNSMLMGIVAMAIALLLPEIAEVILVVCAWWSCATNQIHKWAHQPRCGPVVRWLQHHRIILSPAAHSMHHRGHFDQAYCITSGVLNPLLDRLGFFARANHIITALTGLQPYTEHPSRTT